MAWLMSDFWVHSAKQFYLPSFHHSPKCSTCVTRKYEIILLRKEGIGQGDLAVSIRECRKHGQGICSREREERPLEIQSHWGACPYHPLARCTHGARGRRWGTHTWGPFTSVVNTALAISSSDICKCHYCSTLESVKKETLYPLPTKWNWENDW